MLHFDFYLMAPPREELFFNKKNRSPFDIAQGEREVPLQSNLKDRG